MSIDDVTNTPVAAGSNWGVELDVVNTDEQRDTQRNVPVQFIGNDGTLGLPLDQVN